MKTFKIDIHPKLQGIEVTVKNGKRFADSLIRGDYRVFQFTTNEQDLRRIKQFAVRHGNDKSSNHGNWYAHCNGYAMDLLVANRGSRLSINTYRPYGKTGPQNKPTIL